MDRADVVVHSSECTYRSRGTCLLARLVKSAMARMFIGGNLLMSSISLTTSMSYDTSSGNPVGSA
ncbi:hypothetical protein [Streptomyces sp. NPDC060366]|uniref:hypothetical protein n=1 Tax=Streptomyces sp. NPDC060366 TaxID=3347105 RepID=UPI00365B6493